MRTSRSRPARQRLTEIVAATENDCPEDGDWFEGGGAAFLTQKDLDEMMAGGLHVTPRYWELADKAERQCYKVVTGKDLN
jgi:hypothetical protein